MMPRPRLRDAFNLTYRKIPVMALGKDVYCDTSLICDALEAFYPAEEGYGVLYPRARDGPRDWKPMMKGFASYWIDRPFFRATCGMMPADIWRTAFGQDRAGLIGHALDADKLEKKIPENMWKLDQHLSMMEPMFAGPGWIFPTDKPGLADIAMYTQLWWCWEISAGRMMENLTGGGTKDRPHPGAGMVFNDERYPGISRWYREFERYFGALADTEKKDPEWIEVLHDLAAAPELERRDWLLPTPKPSLADADEKCGLTEGSRVVIAPDDTGKADPTVGTLVASSAEEFVITPKLLEQGPQIDVRLHFPRLAFIARPVRDSTI